MEDGFRVEVELDDEEHGYSIGERLRALDLDDKARERLGRSVMVTRDGSRLFLYAGSEARAQEAERIVRDLARADGLTAESHVTRWHPVEESWKDLSIPLPATPEEEDAERAAREAAEAAEAAQEGGYDWHVIAHLPRRGAALELADRLTADGLVVTRRWRYVVVGVATEERAQELADRLRSELFEDADVRIEVDLSDVARSPLQFLPF
jgi:nucleotide-binding universal stress UspA family protein